MNARPIAILSVFWLLHASTTAFAQGGGWYAGPFDNGAAPNGTDGEVIASTLWDPDGAGPLPAMLVVAGSFTSIEGVTANNIGARDPLTGQWQRLGSGIPVEGLALTVWNGKLVAAGGGTITMWNGSTWTDLNSVTSPGVVYALTVFNGDLYAGGTSVCRWNVALGRWDGVGGPGGHSLESVKCLTVWGLDLYAGTFYANGSTPAGDVWQFDGSTWVDMVTTNNSVLALQPFNGELVAGGFFSVVGTSSLTAIMAWNGSVWHSLGSWDPCIVNALAVFGGQLVAGGVFTLASGTLAHNVAVLTGSGWQPLGDGTGYGTDNSVNTLTVNGSDLLVGGNFLHVRSLSQPANHIARWDGYNWASYGGGDAGGVAAMTRFGNRFVIAGSFNQSDDPFLPAHSIVGWDGASLTPFGTGMDSKVVSLKAYSFGIGIHQTNELVAGGYFTHAGGVAVNHIARWDQNSVVAFPPPAWQPMGSGFNGPVLAIERATVNGATNTYAAEYEKYIGSTIDRWNATTQAWESLGGVNGPVDALKAYGGYLYAGGSFTTAGGVSTGGLARWNGTSWSQCGGYFGGYVYALEVHNNVLVMAGSFPGFGGSPNISTYDGVNYHNLGTGGTSGPVFALHSTGPRLYIGGTFTTAGGTAANNVASWDGAWHPLTSGTDNNVAALSDYGGEIQVGGEFMHAGPILSPRLARFSDTGLPWVAEQPFDQSVASGANVSFSATPASGYGGLTFQWYRNDLTLSDGPTGTGPVISGSNTQVLSIANVSTGYAGLYRMVLSNASGRDTSISVTLTVDGYVAVPSIASSGATVFEALGPNPTPGDARLTFSLARDAEVRFHVHDLAGRRVRSIDLGLLPAGERHAIWDSRASDGRPVAAGLYFVSLEVNGRPISARRVVVVR